MLKLYNILYYNILFILAWELPTDEDKQEIIDAIIESSYFPVTIFIIYVGKKRFR